MLMLMILPPCPQLSKQDSVGAEFTMIYREVSAHKSYILYQVRTFKVLALVQVTLSQKEPFS